jgi:hypothetical protein
LPFGLFFGQFIYCLTILYSVWSFCISCGHLVHCSLKNLATLISSSKACCTKFQNNPFYEWKT